MSNLGIRILYSLTTELHGPDFAGLRVSLFPYSMYLRDHSVSLRGQSKWSVMKYL